MQAAPIGSAAKASGALRRLDRHVVDKPWGRDDIPAAFGDFSGRRVGEIWFTHPDASDAAVLVKFLFTSERLSIQVHPGDKDALAAGHARGKDECWLVLDAAEGAELGVGLKERTSPDALRRAALDGSIVDMVDWRPAHPDDFIYSPAGTIHAIGGGLIIVEVQQNIDCTYRLYDYRRPRELHLDEGLAVAKLQPLRDRRDTIVDRAASAMLVNGPHFHLAHLVGVPDPDFLQAAQGELTFVPLSSGCSVAGAQVGLGEAALLSDPSTIAMDGMARALLVWT